MGSETKVPPPSGAMHKAFRDFFSENPEMKDIKSTDIITTAMNLPSNRWDLALELLRRERDKQEREDAELENTFKLLENYAKNHDRGCYLFNYTAWNAVKYLQKTKEEPIAHPFGMGAVFLPDEFDALFTVEYMLESYFIETPCSLHPGVKLVSLSSKGHAWAR